MNIDYTVAVIGAGPAGCAVATALARSGIGVALASAPREGGFQVGESLSPAAKGLLAELGVWDAFLADGHMPCHGNYSAWGGPAIAETDFIRSPFGHGWHLDRERFDATLRRSAVDAGAALREDARAAGFERADDRWRLELATGGSTETITCSWLVDCTGRARRVATSLGAERIAADRQIAFHARYRAVPGEWVREDRDTRTFVESMECGWLHTALLPGGERVVTIFTDADSPWIERARTREGFDALVGESLHAPRILADGGYRIATDPRGVDARCGRLDRFAGPGWLAAGDAATAYDPLGSYGILFSLHSGLRAAGALAAHIAGDAGAMPAYERFIADRYNRFLQERSTYHAYERRWPESGYWGARRGGEG